MTRHEARLVAEELYKLIKDDVKKHVRELVKEEQDDWLSPKQAADILGVSVSFVMHSDIPKTKVGKLNRYRKSDIVNMLER